MLERIQGAVAVVSAIGYIASLVCHVMVHAGAIGSGGEAPALAVMAIFIGIFVVWFPTVLTFQRFRFGERMRWRWTGLTQWKEMTVGAPQWLYWLANASFAYALANFALVFLAVREASAAGSESAEPFEIGATGHALAFYSAAWVINWAAVQRRALGIEWVCQQGHALAPDDRFCPECGAPAVRYPLIDS